MIPDFSITETLADAMVAQFRQLRDAADEAGHPVIATVWSEACRIALKAQTDSFEAQSADSGSSLEKAEEELWRDLEANPAEPQPLDVPAFEPAELPALPDDIPPPPEGFVYVGKGPLKFRPAAPSFNISAFFIVAGEWSVEPLTGGHDCHYALRRGSEIARANGIPDRDLPALPDGMPPPPEGFIYVGKGPLKFANSQYIAAWSDQWPRALKEWIVRRWSGRLNLHYALPDKAGKEASK